MSSVGNTADVNASMPIGIVVGVAIFFILLTILGYYMVYRWYSSGQDTCAKLYPGNSLKNLRMREECKDRKRGNWALPASAMLLSSASSN